MKKQSKKYKEISRFWLWLFVLMPFVLLIQMNNSILNWTLLLLFFGTTIGSNFFDKSLIKDRFSESITEENLILRKISFYIGVVFLYICLYIFDKVLNSTFYYVFIDSNQLSEWFFNLIIKIIIFPILFGTYWGTRKKILFYIFRFNYINKKLKIRGYLAKVVLDKGVWRVVEKNVLPQHLTKLEIISIDTYQIKGDNRNTYYVSQESEIPEIIEGEPENAGYPILGVTNKDKLIWALVLVTLLILPTIFILDSIEKVDDGIYSIYCNPDKVDSSNLIEISDDTIIYKGKAETFDTRKQSFSMGKVKKNDSNNITVKFYITGKEVQYKKNKK